MSKYKGQVFLEPMRNHLGQAKWPASSKLLSLTEMEFPDGSPLSHLKA
jgi:hypothetical protein